MKPSDLFSHPYQAEFASTTDHDAEPVQYPVFSDRYQGDKTATTSSP